MFLIGFPLLLVPFAIYNIVAFLMPGVSWTGTLATVHMKSGADWAMSGGDVLVALALLLLFVEMVKVVRLGRRAVVDHGLALIVVRRHAGRIRAGEAGGERDLFPAVGDEFLRRARRLHHARAAGRGVSRSSNTSNPRLPLVEPAPARSRAQGRRTHRTLRLLTSQLVESP